MAAEATAVTDTVMPTPTQQMVEVFPEEAVVAMEAMPQVQAVEATVLVITAKAATAIQVVKTARMEFA